LNVVIARTATGDICGIDVVSTVYTSELSSVPTARIAALSGIIATKTKYMYTRKTNRKTN